MEQKEQAKYTADIQSIMDLGYSRETAERLCQIYSCKCDPNALVDFIEWKRSVNESLETG